ncbi:hypothetical protein B0T16DRAFT_1502 [Cercophora newfieldiana]|uniref:Uncharacterized protein n=1 Tax=Cercophora newfieldiana TaxID=92897 RepID=A0AA39YPL1_9PEZI|nr:hypothetical protein B0T16DRAFT_1502 [Cercophora newfieldiana]
MSSDAPSTTTIVAAETSYSQIAVTFVDEEAPKVHRAFGGVLVKADADTGRSQSSLLPFRRLAFALQDYVPLNYGITVGPETPKQGWDELFAKLNGAEEAAHGQAKSPSAIFNKLVFTVGENKRYIDPWIELIPDEFGLGVIKASIAILLNFAEWRAEERQNLFDSLIEIRDIIGTASWKTRSFHADPEVSKYGLALHASIVEAIDQILQSMPKKHEARVEKKKHHIPLPRVSVPWGKKKGEKKEGLYQQQESNEAEQKNEGKEERREKEKKKKKIDPAEVLEPVKSAARDLDHAVEEFSRRLAVDTNERARDTNEQTSIVLNWVITEAHPGMKKIDKDVGKLQVTVDEAVVQLGAKQDAIMQMLRPTMMANLDMSEARKVANPALVEMLLEWNRERKQDRETITNLMRENLALRKAITPEPEPRPTKHSTHKRAPSLTFPQLFRLLTPSEDDTDPETILATINEDLDTIVRRRARIDTHSQTQLQSLFDTPRFISWMETQESDLVLVESGGAHAGGGRERQRVTAMSLFCANFILSMAHLQPDNVYVHFMCGLHDSNTSNPDDPWAGGPRGVLRCVAVQLLVALEARGGGARLDFLGDSRRDKEELQQGDAEQLAAVVRGLAKQFNPDTTLYCVVDRLSTLCREEYTADLAVLLRCLDDVVSQDRNRFKVLLTTTGRTPLFLSRLVTSDQHVRLTTRHELAPRRVTRRVMEARTSSRLGTPSPSRRSGSARRRRSGESTGSSGGGETQESESDYGE